MTPCCKARCRTYLPDQFPKLARDEIAAFADCLTTKSPSAFSRSTHDSVIPHDTLAAICHEVYNFDVPLKKVYGRVHVIRLDRGPTASFKDFAAQLRGTGFWIGRNISLNGSPAVTLETANPAKFPEAIEKMMGWSPDIPASMEAVNKLPENFDHMDADYEKFKAYLLAQHEV